MKSRAGGLLRLASGSLEGLNSTVRCARAWCVIPIDTCTSRQQTRVEGEEMLPGHPHGSRTGMRSIDEHVARAGHHGGRRAADDGVRYRRQPTHPRQLTGHAVLLAPCRRQRRFVDLEGPCDEGVRNVDREEMVVGRRQGRRPEMDQRLERRARRSRPR